MIQDLLAPYRDRTADTIRDTIDDIAFFMNDDILTMVRERAAEMSTAGKMVRGSLVLLVHDMYHGENPEASEKAAAAIEIIHTALLAHDDVIDRDRRRRGLPALHHQFSDLADSNELEDPAHTGSSIAICAGDVGFFAGFKLLATMDVPEDVREQLITLFAEEFLQVGVAEAEDIVMGASPTEPDEDSILDLYRYKTARYTFSVPLMTGAILGGAPETDVELLESIGERLGTIYQLKDDELDLFGDKATTGKDQGSDLEENKKTLHRLLALRKMPEEEAQRTRALLADDPDRDAIEDLIDRFEDLGVKETVRDRMEDLHKETVKDITDLDLDREDRQILDSIGQFCLQRSR